MTVKSWTTRSAIVLGVLILLSCIGIPLLEMILSFVIVYPGTLLVGWIWFLQRVLPSIRVDIPGLLVAIVVTAMLTAVVDRQMRTWQTARAKTWRRRSSLAVVVAGLGVCVSAVFLVGMVHELQWIARADEPVARWSMEFEGLQRTRSKNNLKQIGLGLHNYHDVLGWLPPGGTFDSGGKGEHGWMTWILPYVDQAPLYARIHLKRPWNDPSQRSVFETKINTYQYSISTGQPPSPEGYATSSYAANGLVLGGSFKLSFGDIVDGTSNTLMAGEAKGNFKPWGHPANWRDVGLGINQSPEGFGSPFTNGSHFLLCDGTVRFISEAIDPKVLKSLATPDAGDTVGEF